MFCCLRSLSRAVLLAQVTFKCCLFPHALRTHVLCSCRVCHSLSPTTSIVFVFSRFWGTELEASQPQYCLHSCSPSTSVVSALQILGNKSLKIKYLNPSTVFIATGPPEGLLTEGLESSSVSLTVQIVDTVTGAPIHRQVHKVRYDWSSLTSEVTTGRGTHKITGKSTGKGKGTSNGKGTSDGKGTNKGKCRSKTRQ